LRKKKFQRMRLLFVFVSIVYVCVGYTRGPNVCIPPLVNPHPATPTVNNNINFTLSYGPNNLAGYYPGYTHTLVVYSDKLIKGFVLWGQDLANNRLGNMISNQANTQDAYSFSLDTNCGGTGNSLAHSGDFNQMPLVALWTAPPKGTGNVTFGLLQVVNTLTSVTGSSSAFTELVTVPPTLPTSAKPTYPSSATSAPQIVGVQGGAAAPAVVLSAGAIVGIVIGGVFFILLVLVAVIPITLARVMKDDPRVQRMTNRFTSGFGKRATNRTLNT